MCARARRCLYGALIVVEPGRHFDLAVDHLYVIVQGPDDVHDRVLLNGVVGVPAAVWRQGQQHRIRLLGITAASTAHVAMLRDNQPVTWRPLAKDGADLPPSLRVPRTAEVDISPGETYDFDYAADAAAALRLEASLQGRSEPPTIAPIDIGP